LHVLLVLVPSAGDWLDSFAWSPPFLSSFPQPFKLDGGRQKRSRRSILRPASNDRKANHRDARASLLALFWASWAAASRSALAIACHLELLPSRRHLA